MSYPLHILDDNQQDCVNVLAEALREAQDGRVFACALVLCMEKGFAHAAAGTRASELNLGLDDLKRKILDAVAVDGGRNMAKHRSGILRVK